MNDLQMVARFTQDVEKVLNDIAEGPLTTTTDGIVGRVYKGEAHYALYSEKGRDASLRNYLVHAGVLERYQVVATGILYRRAE